MADVASIAASVKVQNVWQGKNCGNNAAKQSGYTLCGHPVVDRTKIGIFLLKAKALGQGGDIQGVNGLINRANGLPAPNLMHSTPILLFFCKIS